MLDQKKNGQTGIIRSFGAYTKQSHTKDSETSNKSSKKQSYAKQSKTISISWPWSFGADIIDLRFEYSIMGVIKDQRAKVETVIRMTI